MNQTTVYDLQLHLLRYLRNETTLREFREWFDDETWGLAAEPDSPPREMAGEIELRIAEYTGGHLTEDDLRSLLMPLVDDAEQIERIDFQISPVMPELVEVTSS